MPCLDYSSPSGFVMIDSLPTYQEALDNKNLHHFVSSKRDSTWIHWFYDVDEDILYAYGKKFNVYEDTLSVENFLFDHSYSSLEQLSSKKFRNKTLFTHYYNHVWSGPVELFLKKTLNVNTKVTNKGTIIFENVEDADFFKFKYAQLFR